MKPNIFIALTKLIAESILMAAAEIAVTVGQQLV
jgi:hypothetical protein